MDFRMVQETHLHLDPGRFLQPEAACPYCVNDEDHEPAPLVPQETNGQDGQENSVPLLHMHN